MTDKARELLAAEYERSGQFDSARYILANRMDEHLGWTREVEIALSAINAALRTAPTFRCITVRVDGEYGSFYLREGVDGEGDRKNYWCELTCNTAFGVVGHCWGNMGSPAATFLAKINTDYLLGKLWGMNDRVFDAEATLKAIKLDIIDERRTGSIDSDEARDRWDHLPDRMDDEYELRHLADACDWLWQGLSEGDYVRQMPNPQAEGFAKVLWPEFLKQLAAAQEPRASEKSVQP